MFYLSLILSSILLSCGSVASSAGVNVSDARKNRETNSNNVDRSLGYVEDGNDFELFNLIQKNGVISSGREDILDRASKKQQLDVVEMLLASGTFEIERISNSEGSIKDLYDNIARSIKELRKGIDGSRGDRGLNDFEKESIKAKETFTKSMKRKNIQKTQLDEKKKSELELKKSELEKDIANITSEIQKKKDIIFTPEGVADLNSDVHDDIRYKYELSKEVDKLRDMLKAKKQEYKKMTYSLQNTTSSIQTIELPKSNKTSVEDYLKDIMSSQELYSSDGKVENTPLLIALIILFKEYDISLDFNGEEGRAISSFIDQRYYESIKIMYYAGADFNYSNMLGNSPLHLAALKLDSNITELLLKIGLDKNSKNNDDETPFTIAANKMKRKSINNKELLELLK